MLGPYPASTPGVACQGKVTRYKPFELQTHWEVGREGFLKGTDFRKNPGRQDYRKRKWGQAPGSSLRPGLISSDQAHTMCSHNALLATVSPSIHPCLHLPVGCLFPSISFNLSNLQLTVLLHILKLSRPKQLQGAQPPGQVGGNKIKTLYLTPAYRVRTMAQAWQVVPGQDWEGIGRKEKGNGEWEQFLREKIKSWKGGAQSGESARSRWERLLEIGWARRTKVKRRETSTGV